MAFSFLQVGTLAVALAADHDAGDQLPVSRSVEHDSGLPADLFLSSGGARSQGSTEFSSEANLLPKPYFRYADGGYYPGASGVICSGSYFMESD